MAPLHLIIITYKTMGDNEILNELNSNTLDLNDIMDMEIVTSECINTCSIVKANIVETLTGLLQINIRGLIGKQEKLKSLINQLQKTG